jgi:transposase
MGDRIRRSKSEHKRHTADMLRVSGWAWAGLTERHLADLLSQSRRSVNNWLRELRDEGLAYKHGRRWFHTDPADPGKRGRAMDNRPDERR